MGRRLGPRDGRTGWFGGTAVAVLLSTVCWTGAVSPAGAVGQGADRPMAFEAGPPRTISGDGCNWPEYPQYQGGSTVTLTVTTSFAGGGRTSDPVVLADRVGPPTDAPGRWSWSLPPSQLAQPPSWATEVVLRAEASCSWSIGGGFTYAPLEVRRAISVSPPIPSTTAAAAAPPTGAVPAQAVSGSPSFTG